MSVRAPKITWQKSVQSLSKRLQSGEEVPLSKGKDLQKQRVEEERKMEIYRRAKSIWLRLTMKERNAMRSQVRGEHSFYKDAPDTMLEGVCIRAIEKQLE